MHLENINNASALLALAYELEKQVKELRLRARLIQHQRRIVSIEEHDRAAVIKKAAKR